MKARKCLTPTCPASLHLLSSPGSGQNWPSTWSRSEARRTETPEVGLLFLQMASVFFPVWEMRGRVWGGRRGERERERERERRGEINCKRPRWSSLIQQVQPWSSEERVFCWESCCWSTARFSRPQWSGSRWKKVENNKMWKEFKWCECCVSVMNCFTYLKSVFLVLLLSFAQISDSPNSTFLLSLVTQIHLRMLLSSSFRSRSTISSRSSTYWRNSKPCRQVSQTCALLCNLVALACRGTFCQNLLLIFIMIIIITFNDNSLYYGSCNNHYLIGNKTFSNSI